MRSRVLIAAAMLLGIAATVARGDEAALRKRIQELEEQQRQFNEQLRELRRELDRQQAAPAAAAPATPIPAAAAPTPVETAAPQRVEEVERKQNILTEEVRKIREFLVLPETQELKGQYGLGPAASKVYGLQRGLSIGGYGETNFKAVVEHGGSGDNSNEFDFVRLVAYLGYKFTDKLVFNSEIEFEHATTEETASGNGEGEVAVEFATLDYLFHPVVNARAGLMLVPVGFINQVHEPPFYFGNVRPPVETQIIPSTWSSNGVGVFGEPLPRLLYQAYGITSFDAMGYRTLNLREARQSGNQERASDWSFVGRLDYGIFPEWSAGGSMYLGDQGQSEEYGNETVGFRKVGVFTQLYELHTQIVSKGWWFRALGTTALVDDAGVLSLDQTINPSWTPDNPNGQPIGKVMLGAYAELAYNFLPLLLPDTNQYLAPWFRYSWLDTNNKVAAGYLRDRAARRNFYEFGLQYKPIPQIVLKGDYHIQDAEMGTLPYELRLGGGFVF